MKRSEIRAFLNSGVEAINPQMPFGSGQITEWNSNRSNEYPGIWWESDQAPATEILNFVLPSDGWPILLHIGKKDYLGSSPAEYEQLVDDCDYIAQQLIRQYNLVVEEADSVTISSISRPPFIKKHADCVTGVILRFTLSGPDTTNLC